MTDEEPPKPHIFVKTLTDKTLKIDWRDSLALKDIRVELEEKWSLPKGTRIVHAGRVLDDDQLALSSIISPTLLAEGEDGVPMPTLYAIHYEQSPIDPIDTAKDWEQKNRLRFFKAIHLLAVRSFGEAASLLVDCLATFTETAFVPYYECVKYTIVVACLSFERPAIARLLRAPEVLEAIDRLLPFHRLLAVFHECRYRDYFVALAEVEAQLAEHDWLLSPHTHYIVKELRVRAYAQLLRSYRSLTLHSMASAFGVSVDFIDAELSRFIAAGRLTCVIDRVAGIVVTSTTDPRDAQHAEFVKHVDALLARMQKLNRVISY